MYVQPVQQQSPQNKPKALTPQQQMQEQLAMKLQQRGGGAPQNPPQQQQQPPIGGKPSQPPLPQQPANPPNPNMYDQFIVNFCFVFDAYCFLGINQIIRTIDPL